MTENEISYAIRGCIFEVHNTLGPGLLESVYVEALMYELSLKGLKVKREVGIPVKYKNTNLPLGFRMDILVEGKVLIEVKSIETLLNVHHKTVLTYLSLANLRLGILVNFNSSDIANSIYRKVNNLP